MCQVFAFCSTSLQCNFANFLLTAVPKYWQPIPLENGEEKSCHLFTVPSGTEEYEIAVKEFRETMYGKKFTIVKLERIQNFNEYSKQCAFLDVLKRKYSGDVLMKRLFHGTSSLSVEAIAHQGFNRIFAADANGELKLPLRVSNLVV